VSLSEITINFPVPYDEEMKMARKTTKSYHQDAKEGREEKKSQPKNLSLLRFIQSKNCHAFSLLNMNNMSVVQMWLYEQVVITR
jgi:hypothetical protein